MFDLVDIARLSFAGFHRVDEDHSFVANDFIEYGDAEALPEKWENSRDKARKG